MSEVGLVKQKPRRKWKFLLDRKSIDTYLWVGLISAAAHGAILLLPIGSKTKEAEKPKLQKPKETSPKTVKLSDLSLYTKPAASKPSPPVLVPSKPPVTPKILIRPSPNIIIPPRRIPILASPTVQKIVITPTPTPFQPTPVPTPTFTPPTPRQIVEATPTPEPTPTPTPTPNPEPTPTPTPTPTPEPTPIPTPTPTPEPTPIPTPTPTPSESPTNSPTPDSRDTTGPGGSEGQDISAYEIEEPYAFFTKESVDEQNQDPTVDTVKLPGNTKMNRIDNTTVDEAYSKVQELAQQGNYGIVPKPDYGGGKLYELQQGDTGKFWVSLVRTNPNLPGKGTIFVVWDKYPGNP